ncbi:MAG: tetratricopeptide repeat protein [Rubrivivax sp.]|nr:tetratricopeptide repeat protein [Rubrivivax sp.]
METWSLREVGNTLGLSRALVLSLVAAGFVKPARGKRREYRFSFQDMVLLRTAHQLRVAQIPSRSIVRSLHRLRATLPEAMPLTGLRLLAVGDEVAVREGGSRRAADSGQLLFDFEMPLPPPPQQRPPPATVEQAAAESGAAVRSAAPGARGAPTATATATATATIAAAPVPLPRSARSWFERASEREASDAAAAERAYRSAIALDPDFADAWLNLGVLLGNAGRLAEAIALYRQALVRLPREPLLHFNLAVMLEDAGRAAEALAAYDRCLGIDAEVADAHFNAARLHELLGHSREAIRHYSAYRRLTRA